jgi:alpha-ketoglutarate-dependent taurine dioxygenase
MPGQGGFTPFRTQHPAEAAEALRGDGAVILTGAGTDHADAVAGTGAVLAGRLRAYRQPVSIATNPVPGQPAFLDWKTRTVNADGRADGDAHTDGYMLYGDAYPDVVSLLCVRAAPEGGQSAVIDGYRLLGAIRTADPDLAGFLEQVTVEQSTPAGVPSRAPVAARTRAGRLALRCHAQQRPTGSDPSGSAHAEQIERWHAAVARAAAAAPRFLLSPGDLLCLDNYRVFHLRDAYAGQSRLLLRIWAWTDEAFGLPDGVALGPKAADIITIGDSHGR